MNMVRTKAAVKRHLLRTASHWWGTILRDPRRRRGRRWPFQTLMNALWVGALSATPNLRSLERLTERFWRRVPDTTLHRTLTRLSAAPSRRLLVREVRRAWRAKELEPELPFHVLAIDGKSIWTGHRKANRYCQSLGTAGGKAQYVMKVLRAQLVATPCKLIVAQRPIVAGSAETSTFPKLWHQLLADYGTTGLMDVISVDAGMNARSNADLIHDGHRAYVMALKCPQRELLVEAERLLARRRRPDAETPWELYQGKRMRRMLFRTSQIAGYHGWHHLRQAWRVRQESLHEDGSVTVEERYFLTSLTEGQTAGELPLRVVRAHWAIENTGNWTLDTQWLEDDSPWASAALEVVSLLRLLAYNVVMRLRTRRLRTQANRARTWRNCIDLVTDVLCGATLHTRTLFAPQEDSAVISG